MNIVLVKYGLLDGGLYVNGYNVIIIYERGGIDIHNGVVFPDRRDGGKMNGDGGE
jgi:hypothetical protein